MLRNDPKEQYRLFYMVISSKFIPETVIASAEGYFPRLWVDGSNGAPLYDYSEDFEKSEESPKNTFLTFPNY